MATPAEDTLAREIEADRCPAGQAEKRGETAAIWQLHEKKQKKRFSSKWKNAKLKRYKKDRKVITYLYPPLT